LVSEEIRPEKLVLKRRIDPPKRVSHKILRYNETLIIYLKSKLFQPSQNEMSVYPKQAFFKPKIELMLKKKKRYQVQAFNFDYPQGRMGYR